MFCKFRVRQEKKYITKRTDSSIHYTKEGRRRGPFKLPYTVSGYDINNTKGRIAGDSVRENRERTWGWVGLGQGKILETV